MDSGAVCRWLVIDEQKKEWYDGPGTEGEK